MASKPARLLTENRSLVSEDRGVNASCGLLPAESGLIYSSSGLVLCWAFWVWSSCQWRRNNNNNNNTEGKKNNNNNRDDIYGAVIMAQPLQEFTQFIWWMQTQRQGGRQPSDQANRLGVRVRQKEMAATVHIHHRHFIITELESWYLFYRPTEGRRLSWPSHCQGGRQPSDQANWLGLRVCQKERAATIHVHHRHFIITQPDSWYSFYRPTEGGRLSRPRHCSKGVQPLAQGRISQWLSW